MTRSYTKKQRAASEEATRKRIVEAALELHMAMGGGATISAIAREAGVGRVTLYRHFPDELALLRACASHFMERHPMPDLDRWLAIPDPLERLEYGLRETYAYHRQTEAMMAFAEREIATSPELAGLLEPLEAYWAQARDILASGWNDSTVPDEHRRTIIALALALPTWRLLTGGEGLSDEECVDLFSGIFRTHVAPESVVRGHACVGVPAHPGHGYHNG